MDAPLVRWSTFGLALVGVCAFTLNAAAAGDGAGRAPHWQVFATHVPTLVDVDARTPADVWAVGGGSVVHWDGRTLGVTPVPWRHSALIGVSALSGGDVWAVGYVTSGNPPRAKGPIAAHWDGQVWRRMPLPAAIVRSGWLSEVYAASPTEVWAVGNWGGDRVRPLLMRWDGSHWSIVDLQRIAPALGSLSDIAGRGGDDVWAAGVDGDFRQESYGYTDYVLHWNGRRWTPVETPLEQVEGSGPYADAVDVARGNDVWTLNYDMSGNGPSFVRWSGPARTPHVSDWETSPAVYNDLAAGSPTDAWLVGYLDPIRGPTTPSVAHWDGTRWRVQHTPFGRYSHVELSAVSADAADDVWAVGNHLIARFAR